MVNSGIAVAIAAFMRPIDSESETFSVSTDTPAAMLLQRACSEGAGSTQREGVPHAKKLQVQRRTRFRGIEVPPMVGRSVVRLRM
jgi:hypothetical protein